MKRTDPRALLGRLAPVLVLCLGLGCGFINGAGVPHLLHKDDIALCRYCTQSDEVCVESASGGLTCAGFSQLNWCNAAQNLFFQYEAEGPYVTVEPGKSEWQEGFRSDCPSGRNAYVLEALVIDAQNDVAVSDEWDADFDDEQVGDFVSVIDADGNVVKPQSWSSQVFTSNTGADTAYSVEVTFCLSFELDAAVALQITDDALHHSNPVCYAAP